MNAKETIEAIARENKISAKQARADMIVAIHKAYLAGSPEFKIIFGDREPSPEEFIEALSGEIREEGKKPLCFIKPVPKRLFGIFMMELETVQRQG